RVGAGQALNGTPVDCVRVGLTALDWDVDWVVSGVNAGGNLGWDVYPSGTAAAAREAAFLGKPAAAVSQYIRKDMTIDWECATEWTRRVMERLLERPPKSREFWNVNLPHLNPGEACPEVVHCPLDRSPLAVEYRREGDVFHYASNYHGRPAEPHGDVAVCFSGRVAVSQVSL
ncbi:MAG: hypothetical protein N2C14_16885, partial [Planctomycetales bacterium]